MASSLTLLNITIDAGAIDVLFSRSVGLLADVNFTHFTQVLASVLPGGSSSSAAIIALMTFVLVMFYACCYLLKAEIVIYRSARSLGKIHLSRQCCASRGSGEILEARISKKCLNQRFFADMMCGVCGASE